MNITVNVIYTPGTVSALSRFIPLLVANTPWHYRLVSNHCTPTEQALLQWHAAASTRLTVHRLPAGETLPLGKALCRLLNVDAGSDIFAFMDSDIIVTGDLASEFEPLLKSHAAVFSGTPIWAQDSDLTLTEAHTEVAGPHIRTASGLQLGSSYFGLYQRAALDAVMGRCNVTLDKYSDTSTCSPGFQHFLTDNGVQRADYVPAKLANLAFTYLGLPITYRESDRLTHIGGYSMATYTQMVTQLNGTTSPSSAAEILDFSDQRAHMARKIGVCERIMRSFADIELTGHPWRDVSFPEPLERRVQLVEDVYAAQATRQALPRP